jgi:hypothetical protein
VARITNGRPVGAMGRDNGRGVGELSARCLWIECVIVNLSSQLGYSETNHVSSFPVCRRPTTSTVGEPTGNGRSVTRRWSASRITPDLQASVQYCAPAHGPVTGRETLLPETGEGHLGSRCVVEVPHGVERPRNGVRGSWPDSSR